jgi:hypothetical protein
VRSQLLRRAGGETLERGLRDAVRQETRDRQHRGGRRDVQDGAAAARDHAGKRRPHREQGRAQVDVHHQVPALHRQVEVAGKRDRGVVHQHVEAPERRDGARHHRLDLVGLRQVGRERDPTPAALLDAADGLVDGAGQLERRHVGGARRARDVGAGIGQRQGDRTADPAARSRDESDGAPEVHGAPN